MKSTRERTKCLMQKEHGVDSADVIDLPASFEGSWCLCGWTTDREIVSAMASLGFIAPS